jgi:hypothetical protein
LRRFAQSILDAAYLGYLTSDMEMHQPQTFLHVFLFEKIQRFEQFARV